MWEVLNCLCLRSYDLLADPAVITVVERNLQLGWMNVGLVETECRTDLVARCGGGVDIVVRTPVRLSFGEESCAEGSGGCRG